MTGKVKVLIVDDSGVTRDVLKSMLEIDPSIQVVGMAENGKEAVASVHRLRPEVIIMDINMPVMDGFEATEQIMAYCPTPILILSAVIGNTGVYTTFNAIAAGAVDVMEKPVGLPGASWEKIGAALIKKVKLISRAKVVTHVKGRIGKHVKHAATVSFPGTGKYEVVGIGASTGGPSIVMQILKNIPPEYNMGILVVQHMAEGFIRNFAEWLGNACKVKVKLAEEGERIEKGQVLVAPDRFHTVVTNKKTIGLIAGAAVHGIKPSADILFNSIAEVYGRSAIGVLLTGMGADGAAGLKHMKDRGGVTIAQSAESCAVFGMPRAAIERGAVDKVLAVEDIVRTLNNIGGN